MRRGAIFNPEIRLGKLQILWDKLYDLFVQDVPENQFTFQKVLLNLKEHLSWDTLYHIFSLEHIVFSNQADQDLPTTITFA